jgi:hypothetical protein
VLEPIVTECRAVVAEGHRRYRSMSTKTQAMCADESSASLDCSGFAAVCRPVYPSDMVACASVAGRNAVGATRAWPPLSVPTIRPTADIARPWG